jgi:hypothetical protein
MSKPRVVPKARPAPTGEWFLDQFIEGNFGLFSAAANR